MRRGDATRERLLEQTADLVRSRGFLGTSVRDVLLAAGVKKGALYHHFPGKDDLELAVLQRDRASFMAMLDETLAAPTPLEALDRFFAAALRKHKAIGFVGGCIWGNTALEKSDCSPAHTKVVKAVFQEWIARIEQVVSAGQAAGQFRTDCPARELAGLVVAGVEGGIMLSRLTKQPAHMEACLATLRAMLTSPHTLTRSPGRSRATVSKKKPKTRGGKTG